MASINSIFTAYSFADFYPNHEYFTAFYAMVQFALSAYLLSCVKLKSIINKTSKDCSINPGVDCIGESDP